MAAPAERIYGLKLAVAKAVRVAGSAASTGWRGEEDYITLFAVSQEFDLVSPFPRFFHVGRGGFRRLRGHYRLWR
jgi:hypothetical protein